MSGGDVQGHISEGLSETQARGARRIGIVWVGGNEWHGGQIYCENVVRILMGNGRAVPVIVVRGEEDLDGLVGRFPSVEIASVESVKAKLLGDYQAALEAHHAEERLRKAREKGLQASLVGKLLDRFVRKRPAAPEPVPPRRPSQSDALRQLTLDHRIDALFPLPTVDADGIAGVGWIPDFQHKFLPELFAADELVMRDKRFAKIAEMASVVVSSETCRRHFQEFYPESRADLHVWRFSSRIPEAIWTLDPEMVRKRYHLPERFLLVSNQFWKHKDHRLVVEALAELAHRGGMVTIVFTGALRDYRGTGHIDDFFQTIQKMGLHGSVRILGFLSRAEQIALMRRAFCVIQPSRFEGWSTVVEDCRAIGQRVILSDNDVHVEQNPPYARYFRMGDSVALSLLMEELCSDPSDSWEEDREKREEAARGMMGTLEREVEESLVAVFV